MMLIVAIVDDGSEAEGRRCGKCHRDRPIRDFDRNVRGQLQRMCRLCLVSFCIFDLELYKEFDKGLTDWII